MATPPLLFVDSMIVIEAVRTRTWNAVSGAREVVTVATCADELRRGGEHLSGYVPVGDDDLARLTVEPLATVDAAEFRLRYPRADGLDAGERDLLALAATRSDDFEICSCDKAAVVAAHALGWIDRVVSLEHVIDRAGARSSVPLRRQFTEAVLGEWRTKLKLGMGL